jgi:hypothetical protein
MRMPIWSSSPFGLGDLGELADIVDEADQHGDAEIGHQPDLVDRARLDARARDRNSELVKCVTASRT